MPAQLVVPHGKLEAKGSRLGMHAVGTADRKGAPVLHRLVADGRRQGAQSIKQQPAGIPRLHRQAGVHDIGRGQAKVDEPHGLADGFTGRAQEGDDVVIRLPLDLPHALEVAGRGANRRHGLLRDAAPACPRLADRLLNIEPPVDLGLIAPDRAHFRQRVPIDHVWSPFIGDVPSGGRPVRHGKYTCWYR